MDLLARQHWKELEAPSVSTLHHLFPNNRLFYTRLGRLIPWAGPFEHVEHFLDGGAFPAKRSGPATTLELVLIDPKPIRVTDYPGPALDQLTDQSGRPRFRLRPGERRRIREQRIDGGDRVGPVCPDQAGRSAFDPAGDIQPGTPQHAPVEVGDGPAVLIEWNSLHRRAPVADAPEDQTAINGVEGPGSAGGLLESASLEQVPLQHELLDALAADHRHRALEEVKYDSL